MIQVSLFEGKKIFLVNFETIIAVGQVLFVPEISAIDIQVPWSLFIHNIDNPLKIMCHRNIFNQNC